MSIERALIAQARPHMVAARLRDLIRQEVGKGCQAEISPLPVSLEPLFQPIWHIKDTPSPQDQPQWDTENSAKKGDLSRLRVWISPEQPFDFIRPELFIKQLQTTTYRVGFEVAGNNKGITINLLCHRSDIPVVTAAFEGEFESCELTHLEQEPLESVPGEKWQHTLFRDYFPPPPYSHLFTRPTELKISPLTSLITAMSTIEAPAIGLYQVLFQAVAPEHNWHRNVEILLDFEFAMKLLDGFHAPQRYAQQSPSGDLRQMASEVESKAHNDKAFYSIAFRVCLIGSDYMAEHALSSLATFTSLFLHGGRPLSYLTQEAYERVLSPDQVRDMFMLGLSYRPGFLVNSLELTGPVHIPPLSTSECRPTPIDPLETLPVRNPELFTGTWIGICDYAGMCHRVCIPDSQRRKHAHLIGGTGTGKTTTQEHMILSDIEQGDGVAVLDPHGDLIERLLCLIPEEHVEKTIYFNPGDPEWVPIWNPLDRIPGQDIGRMSDDIVQAIQSFVASGGWGDRLEHLLRNMIFSLIHLPNGTFLDISNLLRNKSEESKIVRREILKVIDNETAQKFWLYDYEKYGKDDLGPPKNKLSKLLVSGTVSLMLSQPESRFNFRQIMDEGMLLLVNLSNLGSMVRGILGCFILSLLHLAALSRSSIAIEKRKQFHIHCDEAHRFMTDTLEDLIAETRKYRVSLSLAHQYMSQFGKRKTDAFSSVGSTVIFKVDNRDATYLVKDLQGKVSTDDLVSLKPWEAIARIGTEIVRIKTRPPLQVPDGNFRDRIIEESRKRYCRPAHEVRKWIRRRGERWRAPFTPLTPPYPEKPDGEIKEFYYDEF
jgi:hypothetical protein